MLGGGAYRPFPLRISRKGHVEGFRCGVWVQDFKVSCLWISRIAQAVHWTKIQVMMLYLHPHLL